jgi:hypothetical protein
VLEFLNSVIIFTILCSFVLILPVSYLSRLPPLTLLFATAKPFIKAENSMPPKVVPVNNNSNNKGKKPQPKVATPPAASSASSAAIADIFGALGKRPREDVIPPTPAPSTSNTSQKKSTTLSGGGWAPKTAVIAATQGSSSSAQKAPAGRNISFATSPSGKGGDDSDDDEEEDDEEESEYEEEGDEVPEEDELTAEQEISAFKKKLESGKEGDGLYRPTSDEKADQEGLFRDLDDDVFFSKRSATTGPVKRLEDGTRVVTEDTFKKVLLRQTATKKAQPGSTPHCPFDCDCCF